MWRSLEAAWEQDESEGLHARCPSTCKLQSLKPPCGACREYVEHLLCLLHDDVHSCKQYLDDSDASRSSTLERRSEESVGIRDFRQLVEELRMRAQESSLVCRRLGEENEALQSIVLMEKSAREEALLEFVRAHEELARESKRRSDAELELMEVKSELAALRREQEEQSRELEGMKRQVEQGEESMRAWQSKVAMAMMDMAEELEAIKKDHEEEVGEARRRLEELEGVVEEEAEQSRRLQGQLEMLLVEMVGDVEALESMVEEIAAENVTRRREHEQLARRQEEKVEQVERLERCLVWSCEELQALLAEAQGVREEISLIQDDRDRNCRRAEELERGWSESQQLVRAQEEEKERLTREVETLRGIVAKMDENYGDLYEAANRKFDEHEEEMSEIFRILQRMNGSWEGTRGL
ncbi:hypothetical protein GUITHDRAFT_121216 [Guillardia theta CCMP2712]|uniref:Uncharacterized protein n=1 Tax=Guillardia theta (strain CCMP2712) TaxID=905079 RepID=L1I8N1_GUITC|nr:hypothetical protein GUITHDRAFT_121216 [Guillardia theta CCMP2712]EKX32626.1 hypothetical protein GUITHDRAFT_121216 [Guillardia theta CCMP2712]|eukprot:XP_005819606.1 hypothetical protein GUITHDRAFT_121216 [Guillardia theta CCMP2712]